ncbi:MAG: toprim domain-containing protein [Gordonibacter sp.]|nr:toprim domain-containing protein [Gordonibacter sp.]
MDKFNEGQLQTMREALPEYLLNVHSIENARKPFICLSPDHADRHPSMSYDARTHRVKCFSCGASGDVFEVAGWDTGAQTFPDKVRAAASSLGMPLGESPLPYRQKIIRKPKPTRRKPQDIGGENVLSLVQEAYINLYESPGRVALDYLHRRGFNDEQITRGGWGWVGHPREIFPTGFESAPNNAGGYICLPFPENAGWDAVRYAVFRICKNKAERKELKRKDTVAPLWREYILRGGSDTVYITEGIFDAVALGILLGKHDTCALCGQNTARLLDVVADTPRSERPRIALALDADEAGAKMAAAIGDGLRVIGCDFFTLPPYPDGAKDANDVLRREQVSV